MWPAFVAAWTALFIGSLFPAWAHNAPSGVRYNPECCSARDCGAVADRFVEELGGGHVRVTFLPGSHPMWGADRPGPLVVDFGPSQRRDPLDGEWHACISPSQAALCYHPPLRSF